MSESNGKPPEDGSGRADSFVPSKSPWSWRERFVEHNANPTYLPKKIGRMVELNKAGIENKIDSKSIIAAGKSKDPQIAEMQHIVDEMATASGLFKTPPIVIIRKPRSYSSEQLVGVSFAIPSVGVDVEGYIEMNEVAREHFLDHKDQFKAVMAHEMGHLANGDRNVENRVQESLRPKNHRHEVLADALGSIIHGEPAEYARA